MDGETPKPKEPAQHVSPGERIRAYRWQPGCPSPNPSGRPKSRPISELYQQIVRDPEFAERFKTAVLKQLSKGSMVSAFTIKEMTDRVEGRVTEKIELDGTLALGIAERMRRAKERSRAGAITPYITSAELADGTPANPPLIESESEEDS